MRFGCYYIRILAKPNDFGRSSVAYTWYSLLRGRKNTPPTTQPPPAHQTHVREKLGECSISALCNYLESFDSRMQRRSRVLAAAAQCYFWYLLRARMRVRLYFLGFCITCGYCCVRCGCVGDGGWWSTTTMTLQYMHTHTHTYIYIGLIKCTLILIRVYSWALTRIKFWISPCFVQYRIDR